MIVKAENLRKGQTVITKGGVTLTITHRAGVWVKGNEVHTFGRTNGGKGAGWHLTMQVGEEVEVA